MTLIIKVNSISNDDLSNKCIDTENSIYYDKNIDFFKFNKLKLFKKEYNEMKNLLIKIMCKINKLTKFECEKYHLYLHRKLQSDDCYIKLAIINDALSLISYFHKKNFSHKVLFIFPLQVLITGIIYFKRLLIKIILKSYTSEILLKLYLMCNILASKYYNDFIVNNAEFLDFLKISILECNRLEIKVLYLLDYNLEISFHEIITFLYTCLNKKFT